MILLDRRQPVNRRWPYMLAATLVVVLHIALAFAMKKAEHVATAHAMVTLLFCVSVTLKTKDSQNIAKIICYVMGSEVLWRMCKASMPYEIGKYAVAGIILIYSLRRPMQNRPIWPIIFVLLLVPSLLMTLFDYPFGQARMMIIFNLMGPFVLGLSAWWFSKQRYTHAELISTLGWALVPLVGVLAITMFSTYSGDVNFSGTSNFETSGGFGPNQVSSMLSMGGVIIFMCLFLRPLNFLQRFILIAVLLAFMAQSVMTFSRSGLYMAIGFILASVAFLSFSRGQKIKLFVMIIALILLSSKIILPYLDNYTGGKLISRFSDTKASGREEIFMGDIELFENNMLVGVGAGQSIEKRNVMTGVAPHSEVSRLLAEHGLFGLIAILLLIVQVILNFKTKIGSVDKGFTAGMIAWVFGFLIVNSTRVVAPMVFLGMSFILLINEGLPDDEK